MNIGARIRVIRALRGYSAQQLAERCGISRSVIANIENGRRDDVSVDELVSFAAALRVSPAMLDERVDPNGLYDTAIRIGDT